MCSFNAIPSHPNAMHMQNQSESENRIDSAGNCLFYRSKKHKDTETVVFKCMEPKTSALKTRPFQLSDQCGWISAESKHAEWSWGEKKALHAVINRMLKGPDLHLLSVPAMRLPLDKSESFPQPGLTIILSLFGPSCLVMYYKPVLLFQREKKTSQRFRAHKAEYDFHRHTKHAKNGA